MPERHVDHETHQSGPGQGHLHHQPPRADQEVVFKPEVRDGLLAGRAGLLAGLLKAERGLGGEMAVSWRDCRETGRDRCALAGAALGSWAVLPGSFSVALASAFKL